MSLSAPYHEQGVYHLKGFTFLVAAAVATDNCAATGIAPHAYAAQIMAVVSAEAFIDEFAFLLSGLSRSGKAPKLKLTPESGAANQAIISNS